MSSHVRAPVNSVMAESLRSNGSVPFVSLIMPVRNEADFIAESLTAVLTQDYPAGRLEVLVADGRSTDETRRIVMDVASRYPDRHVTIVDNPEGFVAAGLNAAIEQAAGEIIVRVDGHCRIASDYVSRCVHHLRHDDVDGVGGSIETIATTPIGQAIAAAMSSPFGVGGSAFRTLKDQSMLADTVPFPAYTRQVIEKAGPYDEELVRNQDDEYNYRLRKLGGRLLLAADVKSQYYSRTSLRSLWRQYYQYGYYKVRVMQKHVRQMKIRQFVPPTFVASLIVGLVLALLSEAGKWALGGLMAVYALAVLAACVRTAQKVALAKPWMLLAIFPILHTSYGLGFLVGIVRFGGRARGLAARAGVGA